MTLFHSLDPKPTPDYNTSMSKTSTSQTANELVFLKLGGSLITDKFTARLARPEVIQRITEEIAAVLQKEPQLKLILGHGSGSFGHFSGKKYNTRAGVSTPEEWLGFAEVWYDAASLNQLVMAALNKSGIPAVSFPPSAAVFTEDGKIKSWELRPIRSALNQGLLPIVFGDVVFDSVRGGTIVSTEDLFVHLADEFKPRRILLAGQDPGVWEDFPDCTRLFKRIRPADQSNLAEKVSQSHAPDVTGGMTDKVEQMLGLINNMPGTDCLIFSGAEPGSISKALSGEILGTHLHI